MIDRDLTKCSVQQTTKDGGEKPMSNKQEIEELLQKVDEYKQIIEDAMNALDAALEDLEEAYAEECEGEDI